MDRLLAAGAKKDAEEKGGGTATMLAAQNGHVEVVDRLLAAGADKDAQDKDGWNAPPVGALKGPP